MAEMQETTSALSNRIMPIIYRNDGEEYATAVWQITETITELAMLHPHGAAWLLSVSDNPDHIRARKIVEKLLIEALCPQQAEAFAHTPTGRPYLKNQSTQISFSHTRNLVGLEISRTSAPGIDLEYISPRITRILPRISFQEELALLHKIPLPPDFTATLIWCAKEAAFKTAQDHIDTISQIRITHITQTPRPCIRTEYLSQVIKEKYFSYTLLDQHCLFVHSLPTSPINTDLMTNKYPF